MTAIFVGTPPRTADVTRTLLADRGTPVNLLQHFMAVLDERVEVLQGRHLTTIWQTLSVNLRLGQTQGAGHGA